MPLENRIVTKISADPAMVQNIGKGGKLNVAAYCRVSTDSEDQLESYKAQVAYYTEKISKNDKWKFIGIYADEGVSGTRTKKRVNFNRMIKDCEKGKIDYILTKSVARFARNTIDSLKYVRELKAMGIGVFFEEQNLDSLNADSEMFIGLHSVLAQAESENISANVKWGIHQRMKSGTFKFRYNLFGYEKGPNEEPIIKEDEAKYVRLIYNKYLNGMSVGQIKKYLENKGVKTKRNKNEWSCSYLRSILTNERYCGDMLLQKTYIENCITKKAKKNNGELDKYLITNNHPAIIDREIFNAVQIEIAKRGSLNKKSDYSISGQGKYSGKYALSDLMYCGECGCPYRRRMWKSKGINKPVWRCMNRLEHGKMYCKDSISVHEEKIHEAINRGLDLLIKKSPELYKNIVTNIEFSLTGESEILEVKNIENQISEYKNQINSLADMMLKTTGDKNRYVDEMKSLSNKISGLREMIDFKLKKINAKVGENKKLNNFKEMFEKGELQIDEFNNANMRRIIESVRIMGNGEIIICFKGGFQVVEKL